MKLIHLLILVIIFYSARTVDRNCDYKDAIRYWKASVLASPLSPRAHLALGLAYLDENNLCFAKKQFNMITKINPKFVSAWHMLGVIYQLEGDNANARKYYAKELELDPNSNGAKINLGKMR